MKKPNSAEIRKIAYNCRKATYLIEKKQLAKITARERLELKIHLAGCSVCKTFQQQSIVINRMVKKLISKRSPMPSLDESYKISLQQKIDESLKA